MFKGRFSLLSVGVSVRAAIAPVDYTSHIVIKMGHDLALLLIIPQLITVNCV